MSETERSTGVGSSSNKCESETEVFSTNDNLNSSNGDETMMDTTERGMASPCEKMEAENVEMGLSKKFERPAVIGDCDTLPQTTDSSEGKKKYRMFVVTICGIAMRMIVTDEEKAKNPETAGRALWFCLKDLGDGLGSTDHMNQLKLIKEPNEKNPIYSRIFTNSEIIFNNSGTVGFTVLNNRGQAFICLTGVFMVLAKNELNSKTAGDFREELYEHVLPSLAFTGKAEISPEYAEKIGMDAPVPAPAVTQETGTGLAPVTSLSPIAQLMQAHDAERKALLAFFDDEIAKRDSRIDYLEKSEKSSRATAATYGRERSRRNDELEKCRGTVQKQADIILVLNQKIAELEAKVERLETEKTELDEGWKEECKSLRSQLTNSERERDEAQRKLRSIEDKYIPASSIVGKLHLDVTDKYLKCTITTLVQKTFYSGDFDLSLEPIYTGVYMFHPKVVEAFIHEFVGNPLVLDRLYWTAEFTKHYEDGTLAEWVGDTLAKKSNLTLIE